MFKYVFLLLLILTLRTSANAPRDCHKNHDDSNLPDSSTVDIIDDNLQELYRNLNKEGQHNQPCNHTVNTGGKEIDLVEQLERFENRRERYRTGLWGYCSKEGAQELIKGIRDFTEFLKQSNGRNDPVIMCDRSKLLSCHASYNICRCLVDNRHFRNIASKFWNITEEAANDPNKNITMDQCVLVLGSDCPINSRFLCIPGTNCLFKKDHRSCVVENMLVEKNNKTGPRLRYRRDIGSTTESGEQNTETSGEARQGTGTVNGKYSMTRDDYPSEYCQCFGFQRFKGPGNHAPPRVKLTCPLWIIISVVFVSRLHHTL